LQRSRKWDEAAALPDHICVRCALAASGGAVIVAPLFRHRDRGDAMPENAQPLVRWRSGLLQ
jgi:hypothetical protein